MNRDTGLRVVQIVGAAEGANWFAPICAGLRDSGHAVTAVIDSRPGDLAARLQAVGIPSIGCDLSLVRPLSGRSRLGVLRYPGDLGRVLLSANRLRAILAALRPDVVVTHLFNATVIGRLAAAVARVPVRMAMVPAPVVIEARALRALERLTLPLDHVVVAGSERVRTLYLEMGVPSRRLERVYYGPDASAFDPQRADPERVRTELGIATGAPVIGQVAHFYAPISGPLVPAGVRGRGWKGHESLLRAAQIVLADRPAARFLLVGDARGSAAQQYREELVRYAAELGVASAVTFLGSRADIPDILAALNVSVQCSLTENLGGTIESLLMRVPTVATRVGGMPEAVLHEQTGLLVEPDAPEALAEAILRLLDDRPMAERLALNGRERMLSGFTFADTLAGLDRIIRERGRPQS